MSFFSFCANLVLAGLLLIINGRLGRWKQRTASLFDYSAFGFHDMTADNFSDNFFQAIIHPPIYLAVVGAILQCIHQEAIAIDLWLVVPLYWGLRLINAVVRDTFAFINWRYECMAFLTSVLLSEGTLFFIIRPLIAQNETVFIDLGQFRDAFWFAAIAYIAKRIWDMAKARMRGGEVFPPHKKSRVIIRRYQRFYRKYNKEIDAIINTGLHFKAPKYRAHFTCLVYAVMIYETHNRPFAVRILEYIIKLFSWNKTMSLGIMQVQTQKWISDRTSIKLAIEKLYAAFSTAHGSNAIDCAIGDYNPSISYFDEVNAIYSELSNNQALPPLGWQIVRVTKKETPADSIALEPAQS